MGWPQRFVEEEEEEAERGRAPDAILPSSSAAGGREGEEKKEEEEEKIDVETFQTKRLVQSLELQVTWISRSQIRKKFTWYS